MKSTPFFIIAATSIVFSACDSSNVLNVKFESDAVGSPPNLNPTGNPVGDVIYTSNNCNTSIGDLKVVNDPDFSTNALKYSNKDLAAQCRYLGFISTTVDMTATDELWFFWTGKYNPSPASVPVDIWIGNSHFMTLGGIRFSNGKVYRRIPPESAANYTEMGTFLPGEVHTIIFHVNEATNKWSVQILKSSGNLDSGVQDVIDTDAFSSTKFAIYLFYSNGSNYSASNYVMDAISISKKNP